MDKFGSGYMTERSINDVKDIIVETQNIVNGLFVPCIKTLAEALTIISISSILFLVSPKMAFYALLFIGLTYWLSATAFGKITSKLGQKREQLESSRISEAYNVVYGRSDVRFYHQYTQQLGAFNKISKIYNKVTANKKNYSSCHEKAGRNIVLHFCYIKWIFRRHHR